MKHFAKTKRLASGRRQKRRDKHQESLERAETADFEPFLRCKNVDSKKCNIKVETGEELGKVILANLKENWDRMMPKLYGFACMNLNKSETKIRLFLETRAWPIQVF